MLNRSLGFFWRGLSLMRTAATPRAPRVVVVGAVGFGGTDSSCPPAPARPICALACLVLWRCRSAFPSAVPHPFSCFRSGSVGGSVATWELSAIRSFLPDRPRPRLALFRRAWCPGGATAIFPSVPARPIRVFVRSGFGGLERPSKIPIAARSKFVRRSES